jgi:hypothetical protein
MIAYHEIKTPERDRFAGPAFVVGLALGGKASETTALTVVERTPVRDEAGRALPGPGGRGTWQCDVIHLDRYPLGTTPLDVVRAVSALVARPELRMADARPECRTRLGLDVTAVGSAIVDLFLEAGLPVEVNPAIVTTGTGHTRVSWDDRPRVVGFHVGKTELVGLVQAGLGTARLRIVPGLRLAEVLKRALLAFQVRGTPAAHEMLYAREGADDDLVLAVALACFLGDHVGIRYCRVL